jgi:hypothetical protein
VSGTINIRTLAAGTRIRLTDGSVAEIVSNPADGVWLFVRRLSANDTALVDAEEMVFAQDVAEIVPVDPAGGDIREAH